MDTIEWPAGSFGGELDEYSPGARAQDLHCAHSGDRQTYSNGAEWCMTCGLIINQPVPEGDK